MLTRTFFPRAPLAPARFAPLPAGAVTACDASQDRLLALRSGLLARCASLFPESGPQSAWFGGALGGGMHAPNVLEAMLLTAAQLGDEELRRQALHLCEQVVSTQREDGAFGAPGETFAARGRMLRTLCTAYSLCGEKALLTFMLRYMKFLQESLRAHALSSEDAMHTADTLEAGIFLYNITEQKAVLSVLQLLVSQGADYTSLFSAFPYRTPISRSFSAQDLMDALRNEQEDGYTHHLLRTASGENLCQGLRTSALCGVLTGSGKHLSAPEAGLARMSKAHGAACGGITADPLLASTHPSRGVSAVAACELAASLETLLSCPNGEHGADRLETVMYNAIDAAFSPDGRAVQPMQQANQVLLSKAERFPLSGENAGLFSLSDGDTLCALMSAWPRFLQHQWLLTRDDGLCAMGYMPCTVRYRLGKAPVCIRVSGGYPFNGTVRIQVSLSQSTAFPLSLRIPAWAEGASAAVDGEIRPAVPGSFLTLNRQWNDGDEITLTLPMSVRILPCFHQAVSVARGPLRFAYAPQTVTKTDAAGNEVLSAVEGFAVALTDVDNIEASVTQESIVLHARVVKTPSWGLRGASCDQPPIIPSEAEGAIMEAVLVPYAKAVIRLAVLPVI